MPSTSSTSSKTLQVTGHARVITGIIQAKLIHLSIKMTTPHQSGAPFVGERVFLKSRGLRASVTFFLLPHPLPSTVLLSPHFSRGPNAKTPSRGPNFVRSVRERLLRRLQKLRKNALCLDQSQFSNFAPYIIKA